MKTVYKALDGKLFNSETDCIDYEKVLENKYKTVGGKVLLLRKKHNLNQQDFAEILQVTRTSISNIESNRQELTMQNLKKICNHFKISAFEIIGF